jgi:hypothetical protein
MRHAITSQKTLRAAFWRENPAALLRARNSARLRAAIQPTKRAPVWTVPGSKQGFDAERQQALISSWRGNRYRERGFDLPPYSYKQRMEGLADRLEKIESKLKSLMF